MNKYKILISKYYDILSITETEDSIPEGKDSYYDMGSDMRLPDFLLVKADNADQAREAGLFFIDEWRQKHETETK